MFRDLRPVICDTSGVKTLNTHHPFTFMELDAFSVDVTIIAIIIRLLKLPDRTKAVVSMLVAYIIVGTLGATGIRNNTEYPKFV